MATWPFGRLRPNGASSPDARPILSAAAAGRKRTAGRWGEGTSLILKEEHRKASKRSDFAWLAEDAPCERSNLQRGADAQILKSRRTELRSKNEGGGFHHRPESLCSHPGAPGPAEPLSSAGQGPSASAAPSARL